jgi:hypothetical protein
MNLSVWLVAMVGPLVAKILTVLGFSLVTVTGAEIALNALKDMAVGYFQGVPAAGLQMAQLCGVGQAMGIIFGAMTAKVAWSQIENATRILGKV